MKKKHVSILCAGILSLVLFSCKEDIGKIGLNVQPRDELLNTDFFDTTTLAAYSVRNDSVITSNVSMSLLGNIKDPVFGRTKASIYTQFLLSAQRVNFGENVQIDSLVLRLVYGGYYGDTANSIRIRVYELDEDLVKSAPYYRFSTVAHKPNLLADVQIRPTPNTPNDTSSKAAYMSIPLDKDFGTNKFLSESGQSELNNNTSFVNYFKGLYIEAEAISANGCMFSINLLHNSSSMILYYGNDEKQGQSFLFNINDSCVRFSNINHFDYAEATPDLREQLNGNNSSAEDVLFAQSSGGIKTVIQFPNLKEMFVNQQVVIHKAELVITHKEDMPLLQGYYPPENLSLSYDRSETDRNLMLLDAVISGNLNFDATYFGGTYDKASKQYAFRITKYIQQLLDDEKGNDYKLNLMVVPAATRLSRSMFYGTNPSLATDTDKRMKLKINYTIVKK